VLSEAGDNTEPASGPHKAMAGLAQAAVASIKQTFGLEPHRGLTAEQQRWVKRVRELAEAEQATEPMVHGWFADIKAGREPSWPEPEPPEAELPGHLRQSLEEHLRHVIAAAESELGRRGCWPQAWQQLTTQLTDTMPAFGLADWPERFFGPQAPKGSRGVIPTRELRAFTKIEREVKHCQQCRGPIEAASKRYPPDVVSDVMVRCARRHHRDLFRRYEAERRKPIPAIILEMPAWAAAYRAATAHAALENLDSPMATFAAGAYLEQQRIVAWIQRALLPKADRQSRARFEAGVASGKFPKLETLAVSRARAKTAREMQANRKKALPPVHLAVLNELDRLRKNGQSMTTAVKTICTDNEAQQPIRKVVTDSREPKPWRGNFYKERAVWEIIAQSTAVST
jgi:hypothetical protein